MKKILYCGHGWASNIGNAFVDRGLVYQLKNCSPKSDIYEVSNMYSYMDARYSQKGFYKLFRNKTLKDKGFDLRKYIDCDMVVLGGALLNKNWFAINKNLINFLIKSQKKLLIIGGSGGNNYSKEQKQFIENILKKLNLVVLISRDEPTFEYYSIFAKHKYNGIDNAFFINDAFNPALLNNREYIISVFDFLKEPPIIKEYENVIRLYHDAYSIIQLNNFIRNPIKTLKIMGNKDWISDFPDDYLHLFANSKITFSDRVHACVVTLAFGNKAQFFHKTDRSYLFDRVNMSEIRSKIVSLNNGFIEREKSKQLEFLRSILDDEI